MATMLQAVKKFFKANTGEESNQASVAGVFEELGNIGNISSYKKLGEIAAEDMEGKSSVNIPLAAGTIPGVSQEFLVVWQVCCDVATSSYFSVQMPGLPVDVNKDVVYVSNVDQTLKNGMALITVVDGCVISLYSPSPLVDSIAGSMQVRQKTTRQTALDPSLLVKVTAGVFGPGSNVCVYSR